MSVALPARARSSAALVLAGVLWGPVASPAHSSASEPASLRSPSPPTGCSSAAGSRPCSSS